MDDIAREAGIAKGTIYLSFASKEEVFQALSQSLSQRMLADAEASPAAYRRYLSALVRVMVAGLASGHPSVAVSPPPT